MSRPYVPIDWNDDDPEVIVEELETRCAALLSINVEWDDLTLKAQTRLEHQVMAEMEREHRQRWENHVLDSAEFA